MDIRYHKYLEKNRFLVMPMSSGSKSKNVLNLTKEQPCSLCETTATHIVGMFGMESPTCSEHAEFARSKIHPENGYILTFDQIKELDTFELDPIQKISPRLFWGLFSSAMSNLTVEERRTMLAQIASKNYVFKALIFKQASGQYQAIVTTLAVTDLTPTPDEIKSLMKDKTRLVMWCNSNQRILEISHLTMDDLRSLTI